VVHSWLAGVGLTLIGLGAARLLFLLLFRRPVMARTRGTLLTEMERERDADMRVFAPFDNVLTADDIPFRRVLARVEYEVDDVPYRTDVALMTRKGDRPDFMPIIWYDPADPKRATGSGPSWAILLGLIGGAFLAFASQIRF
jgi:hypothetical protein